MPSVRGNPLGRWMTQGSGVAPWTEFPALDWASRLSL